MDFTPQNKRKITKWIIGIAAACIVIFLGLQNIGTVTGALSKCLSLIMPLILGFEKFTHSSGSKATLIDGNGFD